MKLFTDQDKYPYPLGVQLKELEIVPQDPNAVDDNHNYDLFSRPLANMNGVENSHKV
jgi:hypothetical protein